MAKKITFSVNEYDRDGDVTEKGVFLHFGDTRVLVCDFVEEFPDVLQNIEDIKKELENYEKVQ